MGRCWVETESDRTEPWEAGCPAALRLPETGDSRRVSCGLRMDNVASGGAQSSVSSMSPVAGPAPHPLRFASPTCPLCLCVISGCTGVSAACPQP